jgi:hypothetical protein
MNKIKIIGIVIVICIVSVLYTLWKGSDRNQDGEVPADFIESTENLLGTTTIESMSEEQRNDFIKNTEALVGTTTIDDLPSDEKDAFIKAVEALKAQ